MRVLIVEDDEHLSRLLARALAEAGHVVEVERDGANALETALAGNFDAIVLDRALPGLDGVSVARGLRRANDATPILMLTARDATDDIVEGLDAGADDYVTKPFSLAVLEARLRAIARREPVAPRHELRAGDLVMDLGTREVRRGERRIALTARETAFLELFMRNVGRVLTRTAIEDALWERDRDTSSNVIEVFVRRLRVKLAMGNESPVLETVRGAGYRLGMRGDA